MQAITIPATGLVACEPGVDVVAGLFKTFATDTVPVACGRSAAGPGARAFPTAWRSTAAQGSGMTPLANAVALAGDAAPELIAQLARDSQDLVVVALGPLTNVADAASGRLLDLAAVHTMAGSIAGPVVDGVAEWNTAADPQAMTTVLAGQAPLTIVPQDAVPTGTPEALAAPIVERIARTAAVPAWWDVAAAAALILPAAVHTEQAAWVLEPSAPGRLRATRPGNVRVYRTLDPATLEAEYTRVFSTS